MPVWKDADDAARFVRRYSIMILRLCFTYSLGRADAQDVCQNVFLKLLRSERRFDTEGETRAFILRIAINTASEHPLLRSGRTVGASRAILCRRCNREQYIYPT